MSASCPIPPGMGAIEDNTYVRVDSTISDTTGSCNRKLTFGSSVATNPFPNSGIGARTCSDSVLLVDGNDATDSVKAVQDTCPACSSDFRGQNAHIDVFSSYAACGGHVDACGSPISPQQATASVTILSCGQAQAKISSPGSGGTAGLLASGGSASSGTTTWSETSNPSGLQVTVDLANDRVCATPTTTQKPGSPTITLTNSSNNSYSLSQATPQNGTACSGSALTYNLQRASLAAGQYGSVTATWDDINVTVPVSFNVIGNTRFSQYNVPYESQCSANPQPVWVVYEIAGGYCYYQSAFMGSLFITQTAENGTGVSNAYGIVKGYAAGARNICYPGASDNGSHTFFAVDAGGNTLTKITGTSTCHNTVLSDGTNSPNPLVNNNPPAGTLATDPADSRYACSDQIMMIDPGSDTYDLRTVQDSCPACSGGFGPPTWPGTVAHIDTFNSSETCNPNAVGDYGNRVAIRLR